MQFRKRWKQALNSTEHAKPLFIFKVIRNKKFENFNS